MRLRTNQDVADAIVKWPVIQQLPPELGDEMWRVKPVVPIMPDSFVVMRGEKEIFGCSMADAEPKTQQR